MSFNKEEAKKVLEFLTEEKIQAKLRCIEAGFTCTDVPFAIINQYRDNIKKYCEVLRMNIYEE